VSVMSLFMRQTLILIPQHNQRTQDYVKLPADSYHTQ